VETKICRFSFADSCFKSVLCWDCGFGIVVLGLLYRDSGVRIVVWGLWSADCGVGNRDFEKLKILQIFVILIQSNSIL
jgi:hypothetical protein